MHIAYGNCKLQGVSEKIQAACRKVDVRAVFKSRDVLGQTLTKVKTRLPEEKRKGVVYRIPCGDCDSCYIGETGRTLQKRITEHKYAVKTNDRKNGIAVHAWDLDHRPRWEDAEILEHEQNYWRRRVLEGIWIRRTDNTCNLDCGMTINDTWALLV